jgi:YggT family protein
MGCAIHWILQVYLILLIARIVVSWIVLMPGMRVPFSGPWRRLIDLLNAVTDPALRPFRNLLPAVAIGGMGFDFSPIILFIILGILLQFITC